MVTVAVTDDARPIVLVDDEPVLREATRQLIARAFTNVRVLAFGNGPDALAATAQQQPAIAVLDVDMAPMSGLEIAAALRERWEHLPILFITGTAQANMEPEFERVGAVAWFRKPVTGNALLDAIRTHAFAAD